MERWRWGAAFVAIFLLCSGGALLASPPGAVSSESTEEVTDDPERYFDARVVPVDLGAVEDEEAAREAWLASSVATQERAASWHAYADLSPSESEELLRSVFAEQLATLNDDPARFLSDAQLVRPLGETDAAVRDEGERSLLDAPMPVRTEDEEGNLAKVDLSLEATDAGYETANALTDLTLARTAAGEMEVGEKGFAISQDGADAGSVARRFGDENLFYPEVLPDTDLLVAGTASGVELFNLLRSKESPESFAFKVDLPAGATLRPDGFGGAEVVRDGEILNRIATPVATDAQGTEVPVELEVTESSIVLHVAHREGDYAAPILLDPIVEDWANVQNSWYQGKKWEALSNGAWAYKSNNAAIQGSTCCWAGVHAGLLVSTGKNVFYGPEQFGQWSYSTANSKTYVKGAWITPFWRENESCTSAQPHDYAGMLWEPGEIWNPLVANQAKTGTLSLNGNGHAFVIGMGTGPPGVWIPCARHTYAGGVALWLDDDWGPVIHSVTGAPTRWIDGADPVNLSVNASDEGLGIYRATVTREGWNPESKLLGCTGLYGNRCPNSTGVNFNFVGIGFPQGLRTGNVAVEDPTGKVATGGTFQTRVDYSSPEVTLSGQLAVATDEDFAATTGDEEEEKDPEKWDELSLPVYNLKIDATDGSNQSNLTRRSGVKDIEVWLDGVEQPVPWSPQSATEDSRSMSQTYQLQLITLASVGKHTLEVRAADQVGNVRERKIEFEYFPATGIGDEYAMHYFPLPDGQGNEAEEEHPARPELAVNVINGNLVYREEDVDIDGAAVDLEVERYYNSQLPASENTEWGDGWTLAKTPQLDPVKTGGSPVANEAQVLSASGAISPKVPLPTVAGASTFDPVLRATLEKKATGGYELTDETGESPTSVAFDETGQAEALLTEGHAKVDYAYEGGELAEIEVEDPATFAADPAELEIPEPELITQPAYARSFGTNGSGDGQLKSPGDVAVGSEGNLWVVDKSNNRIQKFDPSGKFLAKFGSFGLSGGQFIRPTAIAVAANGDLLVADAGNYRVQRFSSSGVFLSKFGSQGTGNGQFTGSGPEGIALDAVGNIWVSDTGGGRIQMFNSAGQFVKAVGTKGSGAGQLGEPAGLDFDPAGNVWVADRQNHRVSVFSPAGAFLSQFGSNGGGDGQFRNPTEVEIDGFGNVWVGDQTNHRVQQFDLAAQFKGKFGSFGFGAGQFSLGFPMGIAADSKGHLWVADPNNHRVQEWLAPIEKPTYISSFGANGTGDGQLKSPGDVAVGSGGNLWVVDKSNNRIQKFDRNGNFLAKFGSTGSGDGQFNRPTQIAVDRDGNLLVADAGNNRIQKFDPNGTFLAKFGSYGTGTGQFKSAEGIAADYAGNIWVADTYNGRLQRFDENGQFIEVVGSKGSGTGQLGEPTGIDVGPEGNAWVADWQNNRISVFEPEGDFLGQFGSAGSGPGQFSHPDDVHIDSHGNVWVGDQGNNRVQRFDLAAQFKGQFGSFGFGPGQFSLAHPLGIASDGTGHIWVTDVNNHRIQRWQLGHYVEPASEPDLTDGDPKVEVETSAGLVESVSGNAAGEHDYIHSGDDLIAHDGPEGETKYEYDTGGRMTKVTLPNGTWGSVAYHAEGWVKSVTVDPAGASPAKTTTFTYTDAPQRRTVIVPSDAPHVTYDIGEDGSVLRWWNSLQPPAFDYLAGSLYEDREKEDELLPGDHILQVQAHSEEGVASVQMIANGNQLVHETSCGKPEVLECKSLPSQWVTDTGSHAPGHLNVEVLITDRLGHTAAERFWVDIPEPPPPPAPGTPIPPKFADVLSFRDEYGLEKVFPVANEIERNERIFNLINAWYEGEPVARASMERWGVPMRPADLAELEYREWYLAHNADAILKWAGQNAASLYGGYSVDNRAGGVIYVGFISNQANLVAALKASGSVAAADRIQPAIAPPTHSLSELSSIAQAAADAPSSATITEAGVDHSANRVEIGAVNTALAQSWVTASFGLGAPIHVYHAPVWDGTATYWGRGGPILGGQNFGHYLEIDGKDDRNRCSVGVGAHERLGIQPSGQSTFAHFVLTAGHCFEKGRKVGRWSGKKDLKPPTVFGTVKRRSLEIEQDGFATDAEAVRLDSGFAAPRTIIGNGGSELRVTGAGKAVPGMPVCASGGTSERMRRGQILKTIWLYISEAQLGGGVVNYGPVYEPLAGLRVEDGDSGGPVWRCGSGKVIGLVSAYSSARGEYTGIAPLLTPEAPDEGHSFLPFQPSHAPGVLKAPGMGNLFLAISN